MINCIIMIYIYIYYSNDINNINDNVKHIITCYVITS